MQILLFVPRMGPLAHIHTYVNNTAEQGLANRGNVSTASSIGPMLRELALAARRQHIHVSVGRIPGKDNKMAESVPRLTHLPYRKFISHFRSHFPQNKPWRLLPLPSDYKRQLTTMLLNKQSPRVSRPPSSIKTLLPGANGGASAAGCKSPQTSKTLRTPFPFSIFFSERVRSRLLSAQGQPIKKRSVEQYLRSISQIFASVGTDYPRHNRVGKIDLCLGRHLASYQKEDSPPTRVRPLLVSVIQALDTAAQGTTPRNIAISDLTWVALFFLLRPG